MSYLTDTDAIVSLLNAVASRGFLSQPVKCRYSEGQLCTFSGDEKTEIRKYLAKYHSVLSLVDYPMLDVFTSNGGARTSSLLGMLTYMLSDSEPSPEYVSKNAGRLREASASHKDNFASLQFEEEMRGSL